MRDSLDVMFILKELHKISGFRISVHDTEYREIAAYPEALSSFCSFLRLKGNTENMCKECDKTAFDKVNQTGEVYIYRCKFGLWEAVSPLYHFGVLAGYLMMGQVIDQTAENRLLVIGRARALVDDRVMLEKTVDQIPIVAMDMIESYVNIMTVCSEYITYSNKLRLPERDLAELTMKYIHRNFSQRLTIKELCVYFHCSKSTLINSFEQRYHISVNKYITKHRLDQAKLLLAKSNATICDIALRCGFADQGYFSKVFLKELGMTPSAYRMSDARDRQLQSAEIVMAEEKEIGR